ncbi:DegT/DnrJ/EryC1/StrS family aminotransferase [Patescibacteria group bacterium]|nr:DegT/DnrJ/EryC1/StrS family aminotransferase [Patescibacteria group bacterium]
MKVPFIELCREWDFFEEEFIKAFKLFGQNAVYALGSDVENFEANFAKYCGYRYSVGVSTGLAALEVILRAYDVKSGDEVITVGNSAVATSLAISSVGAKPVFCDVNENFLIDVEQIESLITSKTKAILPVHLFGGVCDMRPINELAKKYKIFVIEDACQAHGCKFINESAVNSKAFSFYPTKNLGAFGEGGIIVTNEEVVRDFSLKYRNYGQNGRYNHEIKGTNYRIDPLQCALLNVKLDSLNKAVERRKEIAKKYIESLGHLEQIKINNYNSSSSFHLFVIRVLNGERDNLRDHLKKNEVDSLVHYPVTIYKQPCYKDEYDNVVLVNTDKFQEEILSLPCYPFLKEDEQDFVIKQVKGFFSL